MNRLAIDAGPANTGWAIEKNGEIVEYSTRRFRDLERGRHLEWEPECAELYAKWLTFAVNRHQIGEVLIEEALSHGIKGKDVRWQSWAYVSTSLLCRRLGISFRPVNTSTLKRDATGTGRATPAQMKAAARRAGYEVDDDHQADVIFMMLMSREGALPGPLGLVPGIPKSTDQALRRR